MVAVLDSRGVSVYKAGLLQTAIAPIVQDIAINENGILVFLNNSMISYINLKVLFGACLYTQWQVSPIQTIDIAESCLVNSTLDVNTAVSIAYTNPLMSTNIVTPQPNGVSVNMTMGLIAGSGDVLMGIQGAGFMCTGLQKSVVVAGCASTRQLVYDGCMPDACTDESKFPFDDAFDFVSVL